MRKWGVFVLWEEGFSNATRQTFCPSPQSSTNGFATTSPVACSNITSKEPLLLWCLSDAPKDLTFITAPVKNPNGWDQSAPPAAVKRRGGHLHNNLGRAYSKKPVHCMKKFKQQQQQRLPYCGGSWQQVEQKIPWAASRITVQRIKWNSE